MSVDLYLGLFVSLGRNCLMGCFVSWAASHRIIVVSVTITRLSCPAYSLVQSGVLTTVELHASTTAASAAAIVQSFTAMDAIKLNMLASDQVRPLLHDL